MAQYEGSQQGVHWSNIHDGAFPFSRVLFLLFIDTLLYLALAWYLDAVVPGEFGTARHPLFCFSPAYWRGQPSTRGGGQAEAGAATPLQRDGAVVEPLVESTNGRGVCMYGLHKEYPKGVALDSLTLQLPCGSITSLLGGNGAGKTTAISMLNGLVRPSAGNATIDGKSILTQMQAIRTSLGVCQQVNTIWPGLTPVQHLRLFGKLRGATGEELDSAVSAALASVGLEARADVPAASLSGGQKRKLCLAIAVLGGSRTLFLDEPTSGMDPHSRRAIWALLRQLREGRTVVLTTHFLDEAEILSDRIAILVC
jgi:ABC-type Na+ transport system ATPase subunit NatA